MIDVSEYAYEKAKLLLAFVKKNPDCNVYQISDAIDMPRSGTAALARKLTDHECISVSEEILPRGKRNLYQVTGKPLPERVDPGLARIYAQSELMMPPISADQYSRLPTLVRAITPVILPDARRSIVINGHTVEQHKQQSATIRKEYAAARRGAVYTGVSRL